MKLSSFFLTFPLLGSMAHTLQSRDVSLAVRDSSSKGVQQVVDYVQIEETLIKMVGPHSFLNNIHQPSIIYSYLEKTY